MFTLKHKSLRELMLDLLRNALIEPREDIDGRIHALIDLILVHRSASPYLPSVSYRNRSNNARSSNIGPTVPFDISGLAR